MVEGLKAIASIIEEESGLTVHPSTAWKYANTEPDPLPVRYFRNRLVAVKVEIIAWTRRQFVERNPLH
jgi:hypothetical protein